MPVTKRLPYQWYDTPNIRVGTFADFGGLANKNNIRILDSFGIKDGAPIRIFPNLRAPTAVFKIEKHFRNTTSTD
jgi:methionine biosynthesis protein MetW